MTTSVCTEEELSPAATQLVTGLRQAVLDAEREALAPRHVAAGVLVVQRVVEGHAGGAHPRPPSTRDTSPRLRAPSSLSSSARTASMPVDAVASTIRPPSNATTRSSTSTPAPGITSGRVMRMTPSARCRSGLVKTSSVGRLGM